MLANRLAQLTEETRQQEQERKAYRPAVVGTSGATTQYNASKSARNDEETDRIMASILARRQK